MSAGVVGRFGLEGSTCGIGLLGQVQPEEKRKMSRTGSGERKRSYRQRLSPSDKPFD